MSSGITTSLRPSALNGVITADFTPTRTSVNPGGRPIYDLVATASTTAGRIVAYHWDYGNGTTSSFEEYLSTTSQTYNAGTAVTVTLTVRDSVGGKKVVTKTFTPTAS